MRKGMKILLFTGLGILAAGLIACFIAYACNGFHDLRFWRTHNASNGTSEVVQTFEVPMDGEFDQIKISVVAEDLEIKLSTDGSSHAEYTGLAKQEEFETYVKDGIFVFKRLYDNDNFKWTNIGEVTKYLWDQFENGFKELSEEGKLTIYLAEKDYASLESITVSGDILIESGLSFTSVNATSVSGEMKMEGIKNLNSLTASTTSGDITLMGSEIQKAEVATTSGEIKLDLISAEMLNASTVSGDVRGRVSADINVKATTTSGDISVPQGTKGNWSIETVSGDIKLEYN